MQPFFVACLYVTTNFITFGYQNNCLNYNITISKPCTARRMAAAIPATPLPITITFFKPIMKFTCYLKQLQDSFPFLEKQF